jgi:hypothetical protein
MSMGFLNVLRIIIDREGKDTYGMEPRAGFQLEVKMSLISAFTLDKME